MRRWATIGCLLGLIVATGRVTGQPAQPDPGPIAMTLPELEDELQRRQQDLERYGERLEVLERENAEARQELEAEGAVLRRREADVRARLITLCRLGSGGYLQMLGGASSWADLFRRSQFVRSLVDGELEALRAHQSAVEALELRYRALDERLASQRQLRERIVLYQEELAAERERRVAEHQRQMVERERTASDPFGEGDVHHELDFDSSWDL